jgi:hypothetical protein
LGPLEDGDQDHLLEPLMGGPLLVILISVLQGGFWSCPLCPPAPYRVLSQLRELSSGGSKGGRHQIGTCPLLPPGTQQSPGSSFSLMR